jgi:hypothetical protein
VAEAASGKVTMTRKKEVEEVVEVKEEEAEEVKEEAVEVEVLVVLLPPPLLPRLQKERPPERRFRMTII